MVNSLYCPLYRGTKWFWTCFHPALSIGVRVFEVWKPFMSAIGRTVYLLWLFWSHKRWTSPPPEQTGIYRFSLLWRAGGFVVVSVIHSAKWEISQPSEFPDVSDSELQVGGWHARFFPLGCSDGLNDMTWLQLSNCTALFHFFFSIFFFSFFKLVAITTNRPWLKRHRLKTFIRLGSAPSSAAKVFVQLYSHVQCYCSTPANRFLCEKSVDSPLINKSNGYIKVTVTEKRHQCKRNIRTPK